MAPSQSPPPGARPASPGHAVRLLVGAMLALIGTTACAYDRTHGQAPAKGDSALTPQIVQTWERRMVEYGREVGEYLAATEDPEKLLYAQYYDGQWVFLRIAEYSGQRDPWMRYADRAEYAYKHYLRTNDFGAAGYRKFPHGLYLDWKQHGDEESRRYLLKMSRNSVYSDPMRDIADGWFQQFRSREVAYAIETQVLAEKAGAAPQPARLARFVDMALTHVEVWITGDYIASNPKRRFCKPFMAGLTASALISYYERTVARGNPDERIPAAVQRLADWLWRETWVANVNGSGYGAFEYVQPAVEGIGGNGPAPDLNMLIAPMYGWLYYHTGDPEYRRRGDAIFAGGVGLAYLGSGKQFNQSYRSSFDYLRWRSAARREAKEPPQLSELASSIP